MIQTEFLQDLISSIELTATKNIRVPSQKYKPSSMHCLRNMYFQLEGAPIENVSQTYTSIGILETGTDRHLRIQDAIIHMKENGFDCEYVDVPSYIEQFQIPNLEVVSQNGPETKLYNTLYNISFACDGVIKYKEKYYIIELKTEGSYKFDSREEVDPSHYNQASAYSLSLGLDEVLFIYIDRNSLKMKSFLLKVTDTMKERILSKMDQCNLYLSKHTIPPKEKVDYKICSWCLYRNLCKSIPNEEFSSIT